MERPRAGSPAQLWGIGADTPPRFPGHDRLATYGQGVGTTGVIFVAIAIAWLAYLVPHFVRRRETELVVEQDPAERFAESMRVVRSGTAPLLDQDLAPITAFEVSTPQTRRAAVRELRRLETLAAGRRRRVLLVLLAMVSLVVGLSAVHVTAWWSVAVPAGLLVGFLVVSRFGVAAMRRSLDARYREIRHGGIEDTVILGRDEVAKVVAREHPPTVTASPKTAVPGVLWDPVPITVPTYVSKPLAPRTVRTIDLSGPSVTAATREGPVTADARPAARTAGAAPARTDEGQAPRAASA
ncbi:MAG: hypothetical protein JWP61_419 [Friedmanniella sp.]|nr:hypothetical protein [Friedmanniella sp.]